MNIVAISGSARVDSYNTALLKNFAKTIKSKDHFYLFTNLIAVPIFSPTFESQYQGKILQDLIAQIKKADVVLFSSPEYIHGIPGGLKNLFDWLVGTSVLDNKKIVFIIASSSDGNFAYVQLNEILNVMSNNNVIAKLCFKVSGIKTKFDKNGQIIDQDLNNKIASLYQELAISI